MNPFGREVHMSANMRINVGANDDACLMWELKKWLSNSFSFQCHPNLVWSPHNSAAALAVCVWKNPVSAYSCVSLDLKTEASIFLHVWFPTPLQRGSLGLDRLKLNQSPAKPTNDKRQSLLTQKHPSIPHLSIKANLSQIPEKTVRTLKL